MNCGICDHSEGTDYRAKEMMFGEKEEFHYWQCSRCQCLQIVNPPADLSPYYPADRYYSFSSDPPIPVSKNPLRRWLKRKRDQANLFPDSLLGKALCKLKPNEQHADIRSWLGPSSVKSLHASILDVGCGSGALLARMAALGFTSLSGYDPFLSADVQIPGVQLHNTSLDDLQGQTFDLIMLHHTLEHVPDQVETLSALSQMLTPGGCILVRIPIVDAGPWQRFGTDWVELDAPRHFFLHSVDSMKLLAQCSGLSLQKVTHEAELFTYMGSAAYQRGLTLYDHEQGGMRDLEAEFTETELAQLTAWMKEDLANRTTGRAAFYLTQGEGE